MWQLVIYNGQDVVGYFITKTIESCQTLALFIVHNIDSPVTNFTCTIGS